MKPAPRGILPVLRSAGGSLDLGRVGAAVLGRATACAASQVDVSESLHQVRVSLKAFRAVIALTRAGVRQSARDLDRDTRDEGRALAGLRDREVLQETLGDELAGWKGASAELAAFLQRNLPPVPEHRALHRALAGARKGLLRLNTQWRALGNPTPSARSVRRLWANSVEAWRQARRHARTGGAASFHAWRKVTKRLEYQGWLLGMDRTPSGRRGLATLHRLQEALGREHDLTVLRQYLRHAAPGGKPPGFAKLLGRISRRRRLQRRRCRRMARGWARKLEALQPDRAGKPARKTDAT